MRILLIQPSQKTVYGIKMLPAYPSLGLLYIAAVLQKRGDEVELIDMDIDRFDGETLIEKVREDRPDIIGFTAVTPTFNNALALAKMVKGVSSAKLILGGIHVTIDTENVAKKDLFDFLVVGEGEKTVLELVAAIERGEKEFERIKGISFLKDGIVTTTPARELVEDLDTLPDPAYDLLRNLSFYMPPDALHKPVATIMTTRGCTGHCTFCCTKQIFGNMKVRARSVNRVVAEIDRLANRFGVREVHIMDDCFTYNKSRVMDFCECIKRLPHHLNFVFSNGIRADQVDEETLKGLKAIGLRYVMYGVESANEDISKRIKKGIRKDTFRRSIRIAKELGLETWTCFIIGLPGETEETIRESMEFAKELDPDFAKFFILKPFPGSEVFNELNANGFMIELNYDSFGLYTDPVHRLPDLTPEQMIYWRKRANREFYFRPKKIVSQMMRIKNWQQFILALRDARFILSLMK